tara:strand:+ start:980 stop:1819 length:840 start_codon:yes stop_codon:yes gene_type:complete
MGYIFIADFFADQILGGGELNNEELISMLREHHDVKKVNSHMVSKQYLESNLTSKYIISNFINLSEECKKYLKDNCKYIIYEHDHKYLIDRNPALYKDFLAPKERIVNFDFYQKALAVFCQSSFHQKIVYKNLKLDNIKSLGGNLWSLISLENIRNFAKKQKLDKYSIMDSVIPHKNTYETERYCKMKKIEYELIPSLKYLDFLDRISNNNALIFFPKTPETLSRIVVEARMMGMKVVTNKLVGATKEEWFKLKGEDLISVMTKKRDEIVNNIIRAFEK